MRAAVVVLGDLGRSPRMQYHARALAVNGADVDLVGYPSADLPPWLARYPRIVVRCLAESRWRFRASRHRLAYAPLAAGDGLRLAWRLATMLVRLPRPDLILVQTPPAVPALSVARFVARRRGARLAVDWHNAAGPLLQMRTGSSRWRRRVERSERLAARSADVNLCVSRAMAEHVSALAGKPAAVLYDRPADAFSPLEPDARRRVRAALMNALAVRAPGARLLVAPGGWTADEDVSVALAAARMLEDRIAAWERDSATRIFPDIVLVMSGKGEGRAAFERQAASLPDRRVHVRTRWFDHDDYRDVLGAADLGLSFHRSASGLDLPMKIADCFGAGLPVAALDYGPCLAERLHDGRNGVLFSSADELAGLVFEWFVGGGEGASRLERLRAGVRESARPSWEAGWNDEARDLLMPKDPGVGALRGGGSSEPGR